jgi:hypothetical protein
MGIVLEGIKSMWGSLRAQKTCERLGQTKNWNDLGIFWPSCPAKPQSRLLSPWILKNQGCFSLVGPEFGSISLHFLRCPWLGYTPNYLCSWADITQLHCHQSLGWEHSLLIRVRKLDMFTESVTILVYDLIEKAKYMFTNENTYRGHIQSMRLQEWATVVDTKYSLCWRLGSWCHVQSQGFGEMIGSQGLWPYQWIHWQIHYWTIGLLEVTEFGR